MSVIAVEPIFMQDALVELGTGSDDYAAAVSSVTLTPSTGTSTWKGLKPGAVFTFAQKPTWTLDLNYAQDWASATSLSTYLHDHEGETVPFTVQPQEGDDWDSFTGQVILVPGPIGGGVDGVGEATVSMGVLGKPQRVPHA